MNRLKQFSLMMLLSGVITTCATSCAPTVQELNLSQEVVNNLPREQALSFLQTLRPSPLGYVHCVFDQDGVGRWIPQQGSVLPGKTPYSSLLARPKRPGIMIVIVLYDEEGEWCIIPAESNADTIGRGDYNKFTGKILMALMSLGVTVKAHGGGAMQAQRPASE